MLTKLKKFYNNRARQELEKQNALVGVNTKKPSSVGLRAKVIRADGTVEPERLVSYAHRNIFIHMLCAPLAYFNGWFWNAYYTRKRRLRT